MPLPYDAPPFELARELAEVRSEAWHLVAHIERSLNAPLPKEFPKETVLAIAGELVELEAGTQRGCVRPLSYADQQLSEIRSQHIAIASDYRRQLSDADTPQIARGETLDQHFIRLLSAIATARRVADRLAAEDRKEEEPELSVSRPKGGSVDKAISKAQAAHEEALKARQKLDKIRRPDSTAADKLRREITDAKVLARLGQIELLQPRVMAGWLERIGTTLKAYPTLIEASGAGLRAGVDFADRAHHHLVRYESLVFKALTSVLRSVAEDFEAIGKKLKEKELGSQVKVTAAKDLAGELSEEGDEDTTVPPHEFTIGNARRLILSGMAPPYSWWPFIDDLDFTNETLKSIEPIANLRALQKLVLSGTQVESIEPISDFNALRELNLSGTQVADLGPIAHLKALESLNLWYTPVTDLRPLAGLHSLRKLNIGGTAVSDLSHLSELWALESLNLWQTNIEDISPLASLRQLEVINIRRTRVTDVSPLAKLPRLKMIDISDSNVQNISVLSRIRNLQIIGT